MASRSVTPETFKTRYRVAENGCWEWQGAHNRQGYGHLWYKKKMYRAHRLAWLFAHGSLPADLDVCHRCDNPPCVNPEHLFLGTAKDNIGDMMRKGRDVKNRARGVRQHSAKLTEDQVRELRALYAAGTLDQWGLARKYGLWQGTVWKIIHRKSWAHVD